MKKKGSTAPGKRKGGSIAKKLGVSLISITAVAIIVVMGILYLNAADVITDISGTALQQESAKEAMDLSNTMTGIEDYMNAAVDEVLASDVTDIEEIKEMLAPTMSFSTLSTSGVYIGLEDNTWIDPSDWVPDADYVTTEKDWYKEGLNHDTFEVGTPYVDAETGGVVVSLTRKVTMPDGRPGVASCDVKLDEIVNTVSSMKPMKTGGAMLLSTDYVLSYFKSDLNGKAIADVDDSYLKAVAAQAAEGSDQVTPIRSYNGTTYDVVFSKVDGTDWTLCSSVEQKTVLSGLRRVGNIAATVGVICVIAIAVVLLFITRKFVVKPVSDLTEDILKIADGDFTIHVRKNTADDEIGRMSRAMEQFVQNMHGALVHISGETDRLSGEAGNSRNASGTLNEQAKEQSESMEQISSTMDGMAEAVTELAENASNLAEEVTKLTDQGNTTKDTVDDLLEKAGKGQQAMAEVETEVGSLTETMQEINTSVKDVGESAAKINSIIEMINSIADQTNLLSLNASIEAARAGEAGKGFAVVASEIGKLASDSADATKQIAEIIGDVTEKIQALSDRSGENMDQIKVSAETVKNSGGIFREIFASLDETGATVKEMVTRVGKVNDIASSLAAIAEEQSASTEEVTATVDNLAATAQHVADSSKQVDGSADSVNKSADSIEGYIHKFRL